MQTQPIPTGSQTTRQLVVTVPMPAQELPLLRTWWDIRWPHRPWQTWMWVCVGYVVLTLLWTWPLLPAFGTHAIQGVAPVPETPVDIAQNAWNIWQFRLHWADGSWPLATQRVFFPMQINLTYQTFGLPNLLVAAPWATVWGEISAMNALVCAGFILGALGMYALLAGAGVAHWLAFGLGWVFVITPAHLAIVQTSGIERALLGWLMVLHWVVARFIRQPDVWRSLVLGAVFVVVSLNSGYYGLYGLVYTATMLAAALTDATVRARWQALLVGFGAAGAGWGATMAALMTWPASGYLGQRQATLGSLVGESNLALEDWYLRQTHPWHVVSMLDLVRFPVAHPVWRALGLAEYTHPGVGGYLGLGVIALVGYGLWRFRSLWPLVAVSTVTVWLACGPEFKLWPEQTAWVLPAPYSLLNLLSVYRNATRPGMFLLYAWIPLTLILAQSLTHIAARRRWYALVCMVLLWLDFAPQPWGLVPMTPSPIAAAIPKTDPAGAVLEVPARIDEGQGLIDQMCHGRPLAAGYLARVPGFYLTPMYGVVMPPPQYEDVIPTDPIRELGNLGVRFLVVHSDAPYFVLDHLTRWGTPLAAKVGRERVFAIPAPSEASLVADKDWWDSEQTDTTRWRWTQARSRLIITSDRDRVVRISMTTSSTTARVASWSLNGAPAFTTMVPAQPAMDSRVVSVPVHTGVNYLDISSATSTDIHGRAVGIAFTRLAITGSTIVRNGAAMEIPATERDTVFCR